MKKYYLIFLVLFAFSSCLQNTGSVNIGLKVKLLASKSQVLPLQVEFDSLFVNHLKSNEFPHYQGKTFLLFDTIFTSTLLQKTLDDYSFLPGQDAVLINKRMPENGLTSLLFRDVDFYVYRTLIPENEQEQIIITDILSRDSTKISRYFTSQKIQGYIKK